MLAKVFARQPGPILCPMAPRRSLTASDGVELAYWLWRAEGSDDRLLLLLHGAASNHTRWSEFVEFTRLRESWNVLAPDLRGNGESMVRGGQSCRQWSRDLIEMLDAEGAPTAVVVGHSLGAQIAMHLAHRHRSRVRGLVLLDPVFPRGLQGRMESVRRWRRLVRAMQALITAANNLGMRRRHIPNRDIRKLDEETREALRGADSFEQIAKKYSALGPILRCMPTANYLGQALATVAPVPPLEEIAVPVAVLLSGGTTLARSEINREEAARFPNATRITLEANHWPLTEAPESTRRAIEEWVEQTFGAEPGTGAGAAGSPAPAIGD